MYLESLVDAHILLMTRKASQGFAHERPIKNIAEVGKEGYVGPLKGLNQRYRPLSYGKHIYRKSFEFLGSIIPGISMISHVFMRFT